MNRWIAIGMVLLCWPSAASAQLVLTGGTVHVGNGEVIEGGVVVIGADGKVGAVGKNAATPANAKVVDVTGKIVTPGFIDAASYLGLVEIWAVERSRDGDGGPLDNPQDAIRAAFRAADAFNPMAVAIPVARAGGVTSAVALPWGGLISGQPTYIELLSDFGHGRVVEDSLGVVASLGSDGGAVVGGSRAGAMLILREALDDARFWQANRSKYDENRARVLVQSRLDSAALAAVLDGKPLMIRVNRASDILAALALAREYKIRIVLLGAAEGWLVASEIASAKVPVIVHPTDNLPENFDALGTRADNAALLDAAGVIVALSTFDAHYVGQLRYLAGNAVRQGLDHEHAITAVTLNAAKAAGVDASVGTLQAGKAGNVVVWSGDPFEISTRVESVWIGGKPVPTKTRQDELFERYRTLQRRGPAAMKIEPVAPPEPTNQTGEGDVESDD